MTEYGIFTDEGCIEAQMYSEGEARKALATYADDDTAYVSAICEDHPEQPADTCEECADEGDEEEDE